MKQSFIKLGETFYSVSEIESILSDGNYIQIFIGGNRIIIRCTLQKAIESLPENFFLISRKEIVNLNQIIHFESWFNDSFRLTMRSGKILSSSRRKSSEFKKQFNIIDNG